MSISKTTRATVIQTATAPAIPPSRGTCRKKVLDGIRPASKKLRKKEPSGSAGGLSWILGKDLSVDDFRNTYFEQKPLHVQRHSAEASDYYNEFHDLSMPEALFKLMDEGTVPVYRINMYRCTDGSTKENADPPPQTVDDARRLFSKGWSIQWLQPQQEHDALARLVSILESELGSLVGVNAYLTPPGVQGLAPHWDDVEVFVLQLGGSKAWHLHKSTSSSPLPPEAQTLPWYISGDLPLESLSPAISKPVLKVGDLLYMPRGTIHYAPNQDKKQASVHLTISTYQEQSMYDLVSKTFEEAMAKLWETDTSLRRGLPWRAFAPGTPAYPKLCSTVSDWLRRAADAVGQEAKAAASGDHDGSVAGALASLSSDFVRHRMPPLLGASGAESCAIVTPSSHVEIVDPSFLTLLPGRGQDGKSASLIHCMGNSRREHMAPHESDEEEEEETGADKRDRAHEADEEEDEEEEEDNEEEEEEESELSEEVDGQMVSPEAASILRELCSMSATLPLAVKRSSSRSTSSATGLASLLLRKNIPESSWPDVCNVLTQLSALGLVRVGAASLVASQRKKTKRENK